MKESNNHYNSLTLVVACQMFVLNVWFLTWNMEQFLLYLQVASQEACDGRGLHQPSLLCFLHDYLCAVNILSFGYGVRSVCVKSVIVFLCAACVCVQYGS